MTSWPQLDLNNLGRGWVIFFKNYIFKISGSSWEKWATARLTSFTREPSYSSFFSAWSTDFKNLFFEKIHWALSEVVEVKRSFSRSMRPNFGFHLVLTSFYLEFLSYWILRLFYLGDLSVLKNGTRKHFENGLKSMQIFQRIMGGMNCR